MVGSAIEVYLELGPRRTFACAVDWPGWCRIAKSEEAALEALTSYAARYDELVVAAGHSLPARWELAVIERLPGSSGTDFGMYPVRRR